MHCPFRSPKRCKQNAADPRNGDNEKHSLSVYRARPACKLPRTAVRGEQVCTGGLIIIRPLSPAEWAFKRFVISDARPNIIADFSLRETHLGEGSGTTKADASTALAGVCERKDHGQSMNQLEDVCEWDTQRTIRIENK